MFFFKRKAKQQESAEVIAEVGLQEAIAEADVSSANIDREAESDSAVEFNLSSETESENSATLALSEGVVVEHQKLSAEFTEDAEGDSNVITSDLAQDQVSDTNDLADIQENNSAAQVAATKSEDSESSLDTGELEDTAEFNPFSDSPETELDFVLNSEADSSLSSSAKDGEDVTDLVSDEESQKQDEALTAPLKNRKNLWLIGPNSYISFVVTICWICLAVFAGTMMYGMAATVVLAVSIVAAILTLVIGISLIVVVNEKGVKPLFRTAIPWENIIDIHMESIIGWGKMNTPTLSYSKGRAIREMELEGLSSIGSAKGAEKRAWKIADFGEIDFIVQEKAQSQAPRRSA